jgi:hypothetical protein
MNLLSDLLEPTPQDRLQAIATILARGLRRLRSQRHSVSTESPEKLSDSLEDCLALSRQNLLTVSGELTR